MNTAADMNAAVFSAPALPPWERRRGELRPGSLLLFSAAVAAGAAAGSLLSPGYGAFAEELLTAYASPAAGWRAFLWYLGVASWPCLAALFFATSMIGFLVMPLLFFLRGFFLALCVSVMAPGGVWETVLWVGAPALFSLAAFFLVGEAASDASRELCRICAGHSLKSYPFVPARRLLLSVLFLAAAALLRQFLIPLIL